MCSGFTVSYVFLWACLFSSKIGRTLAVPSRWGTAGVSHDPYAQGTSIPWGGVELWWGQLVISPLWAQEQSSGHLLEIASRRSRSRQASFLPQRVPEICLPIVAMSSPLYSQPFGMPLSLHKWWSLRGFDKVVTWITIWLFGKTCCNERKGISETLTATGQSGLAATRLLGRSGASSRHGRNDGK